MCYFVFMIPPLKQINKNESVSLVNSRKIAIFHVRHGRLKLAESVCKEFGNGSDRYKNNNSSCGSLQNKGGISSTRQEWALQSSRDQEEGNAFFYTKIHDLRFRRDFQYLIRSLSIREAKRRLCDSLEDALSGKIQTKSRRKMGPNKGIKSRKSKRRVQIPSLDPLGNALLQVSTNRKRLGKNSKRRPTKASISTPQ